MWKTFTVQNDLYILKIKEVEQKYKLVISDLRDVWSEEYSKDDISQSFQQCNSTITIKTEDAVAQVLNMFQDIEKGDVVINKTDNKLDVSIKLVLDDTKIPIKYKVCLIIADRDKFSEIITAPMIHTINFLEKQKKMLCDLIQKKDRELEEYRMEKGSISRDDLVTEKVNVNTVNEIPNENLMLNVYGGNKKFWENFIDTYGKVEANVAEVKVNPWNNLKRKKKVYNAETSKKKKKTNILYKNN